MHADEDADGAVVGIAREKDGMVVSRDSDLMLMDSCGYIDMPQFFEYGLQREDPRGPKLLTPVFHPGTPSFDPRFQCMHIYAQSHCFL